jgi:predicted O-methyltransferase YrrM
LADDVLWDGKVLEDVESKDKQTQGILAFNDFIQNDERVENLMLPIRHGLMMIRKK